MKKLKMAAMLLAAGSLGWLLAGCGSMRSVENLVQPGVVNKTGIAYGESTCSNAEYPKEFYVTADASIAKAQYADELVKYTGNGLRSLGLTQLSAEKSGALLVTVKYEQGPVGKRQRVEYIANATVNGQPAWMVKTYCFGRPDLQRNYLPGLVAGAMPMVGANKSSSATNINKYRYYLEAVMGHTTAPAK